MATPTKQQIVTRATELYMQEQARHPGLGETLPEECELKEAGFLDAAKRELMSSEYQQDSRVVEDALTEMGLQEQEGLNAEKIEALQKQVKNMQDTIMAKLEAIPDLDQQVNALLKSRNFQNLGKALSPFTENKQLEKPVALKKTLSFPSWLRLKQPVKLLDAFAGVMVFLLFIGFSFGLTSALSFGWGLIAAFAGLWLGFVIVFRLVVGGILD